jgi:hypothetical protein
MLTGPMKSPSTGPVRSAHEPRRPEYECLIEKVADNTLAMLSSNLDEIRE